MAKKVHNDDIDESFIIASIKQERKPEPVIDSAPKVEPIPEVKMVEPEPKATKKSRGKLEQFEELFFKESSESARSGRGITIRPEFHDDIADILHLLGNKQMTIFSYIDNILAHHFEYYKTELEEFHKERYKKPKYLSR